MPKYTVQAQEPADEPVVLRLCDIGRDTVTLIARQGKNEKNLFTFEPHNVYRHIQAGGVGVPVDSEGRVVFV
jgi:hypothetical protein